VIFRSTLRLTLARKYLIHGGSMGKVARSVMAQDAWSLEFVGQGRP
jgi:hypothetical protein